MKLLSKILLILFLTFQSLKVYSNIGEPPNLGFKLKDISLITKKKGVYIGYERGFYDVLGFGMEFQRKNNAIKNSKTDAVCFGFSYNFKNNILGYDIGYWHKDGIVGLTYGADIILLSDFKNFNAGISPTIGFRFSGFHLQTGYKLMVKKSGINSNNLFIRLRFTIHKETDRKIKRTNK